MQTAFNKSTRQPSSSSVGHDSAGSGGEHVKHAKKSSYGPKSRLNPDDYNNSLTPNYSSSSPADSNYAPGSSNSSKRKTNNHQQDDELIDFVNNSELSDLNAAIEVAKAASGVNDGDTDSVKFSVCLVYFLY